MVLSWCLSAKKFFTNGCCYMSTTGEACEGSLTVWAHKTVSSLFSECKLMHERTNLLINLWVQESHLTYQTLHIGCSTYPPSSDSVARTQQCGRHFTGHLSQVGDLATARLVLADKPLPSFTIATRFSPILLIHVLGSDRAVRPSFQIYFIVPN